MDKPVVIVDMDGVLVDVMPLWVNRVNQKYGTQFCVNDFRDYNLKSVLMDYYKFSEKNAKDALTLFDERMYEGYGPSEVGKVIRLIINECHDKVDFVIYTKYYLPEIAKVKALWLHEHGFTNNISRILYERLRHGHGLGNKNIDGYIMIDDNPNYLYEFVAYNEMVNNTITNNKKSYGLYVKHPWPMIQCYGRIIEVDANTIYDKFIGLIS